MLQAYFHAAVTLNYVRALIEGGFADLHHPEYWDLGFIGESERHREYSDVVARILDAISFMEACGSALETALGRIDFFTSHEALVLPLRGGADAAGRHRAAATSTSARTCCGSATGRARSTARTSSISAASPTRSASRWGPRLRARRRCRAWWSGSTRTNAPGRMTLITRLGAGQVETLLPPLIGAVRAAGARVLWSCDPMHGNTVTTAGGIKTRDFEQILRELERRFAVHQANGSRLGGVHFELTGEDVTECIGGARRLTEADLPANYSTYCDPRLNAEQSLEMAFLIAGWNSR